MSATATLETKGELEAKQTASPAYTFLAPGFAKWWGSDGRALALAFRRLGHKVLDIDEEDYVPWRWEGAGAKVLRRLFGSLWVDEYNRAVVRQAESSTFDFVLVFKGNLLKPATVEVLRAAKKPLFNFYPDLSFQDHGSNIPATLHLYDTVFTTKSYHGEREIKRYGIQQLVHVRHGFDPEVHRPIVPSAEQLARYGGDVSFVGCWSPRKEQQILHLLRNVQGLDLKVYGLGWKYAGNEFKQRLGPNLRAGVFGDELAIVYCASKINLGLLSCGVSEPDSCDQTTARTFQIPATNSLMLHEDTAEVRALFRADEEVLLFSNNDELISKVKSVLSDEPRRLAISERGHRRVLQEPYDYSSAARTIAEVFAGRR